MASYHGDFVGVIEGQMGVDKDAQIRDCRRESQSMGKDMPCMRICIEDDDKE